MEVQLELPITDRAVGEEAQNPNVGAVEGYRKLAREAVAAPLGPTHYSRISLGGRRIDRFSGGQERVDPILIHAAAFGTNARFPSV